MAWVDQIRNDPLLQGKVDWETVEEAHRKWQYDQQGLTPEGAAIVTLVVAFFTWGAASGAGAAVGQAAAVAAGEGAASAAIASVVGGAVTAGVSALATQAAVSFVNNRGDLGHRWRHQGLRRGADAV
jgi:filamentous hemagglutinin